MTVRNSDTGESFEVIVPDGLRINGYNTNWLDSIPYLIEHARWHEPWAYEALAECYRYGKGGIEKSIFNAIICYEIGGFSPSEIAKAAYEANPSDELGLLDHLMDLIDKRKISDAEAISLIDSISAPMPKWLNLIKTLLTMDPDNRNAFIEASVSPEMSSDELLICYCFQNLRGNDSSLNPNDIITDEQVQKFKLFGDSMPALYDLFGQKLWRLHLRDAENSDKYLDLAFESMFEADKVGFLSKTNMGHILSYYNKHGKERLSMFSEEDFDRFNQLCSDDY